MVGLALLAVRPRPVAAALEALPAAPGPHVQLLVKPALGRPAVTLARWGEATDKKT